MTRVARPLNNDPKAQQLRGRLDVSMSQDHADDPMARRLKQRLSQKADSRTQLDDSMAADDPMAKRLDTSMSDTPPQQLEASMIQWLADPMARRCEQRFLQRLDDSMA